MHTPNTLGLAQLFELQELVEKTISELPKAQQELLWDMYRKGETVGTIRNQLHTATKLKDAGYSREHVSALTQLPEADLSMWEEINTEELH